LNNLIKNVQPFFADLHDGGISISHNGNLSNALLLRKELVKNGSIKRKSKRKSKRK
jgi:amidophosphoribosyltransferase